MNLVERIIEYYIKKYGVWLMVFFIVPSAFLVSWFMSLITSQPDFLFNLPATFEVIFLLIGWILLIIISIRLWEKIVVPFYLRVHIIFKNKIDFIPRISKWIFQGSLKTIGDSLELTASDSGCLIKDRLYKNFIMKFNLEILNGGRAGIVFRAQDLENYLMIQIVLADTKEHGTIIYDIVPHVRFSGNWETFNITYMYPKPEPYYQPTKIINYYHGIPIELEVENNVAILIIKSNNVVEKFKWNIPTHTEANTLRHTPFYKEKQNDNQERKLEKLTKPDPLDGKFVPRIWFRNKYGRVGFRAHSWEKMVVSNLKIRKI